MDKGVGGTLREARERRRIDLAQIESATKIRARFLRAIEAGEWDVLPGEAYARGFIRTYASYLGLDGARLAEEHRREVGVSQAGEWLPAADPTPIRPRRRRRERRISPRALAAVVSIALVAILVAVGLSSGGDGGSGSPAHHRPAGGGDRGASAHPAQPPKPARGQSLRLTATAEVWVCLLDSAGEPLLDGQILAAGSEAGPFRSGSFTVSLGNGEVSMTVNGQQASIPATPSPVGFAIGAGGEMRPLSEGERPTCT